MSTSLATAPIADAPQSLRKRFSLQRLQEGAIRALLFGCALLSVLTTIGIVYVLFSEAVFAIGPWLMHLLGFRAGGETAAEESFFEQVSLWQFLTDTRWTPNFADKHYGILPLVCGTFLVAGMAGLIGLPLGLSSAIYLSEYASPKSRAIIKPVLEILAGIPTVVFGYFGLAFVTPWLLKPIFGEDNVGIYNAAAGGIVVGIMIVPLVASLGEDVLRAVPRGLREAGYALGATKFDVSVKIVVPSALSGILAAFLLALSRAVGETMAVAIAVGQQAQITLNPFDTVMTMTAYVVNVSGGDTPVGSIEYKSLYAVALVLFLITLSMNILSHWIMTHFREVYQ